MAGLSWSRVRPGVRDGIPALELRGALRGYLPIGGAVAFGALAAAATLLTLSVFRTVGLSQVTPAAIALLNLALLVPTALALVAAAVSIQSDREGGALSMLRTAGVGAGELVWAKIVATAVAVLVALLAGLAVVALLAAGTLRSSDLPAFLAIFGAGALAVVASTALGAVIGALFEGRSQAAVAALSAWLILALGIDLVALAIVPALGAGAAVLLAIVALDPLDAARTLGLVAFGGDIQVLGPSGAMLLDSLGPLRAIAILASLLVLWAMVAGSAAAALLRRAELR